MFPMVALLLILSLLIGVGIYTYLGSQILSRAYEPDLVIASGDGRYELVVREFSCLGGAGAELYIRKPGQDKWYNSWMEKKIETISTDDYYQTFTNGTYDVEWKEDHVTVYFCQGVPAENKNDRTTWCGLVHYDLK
jgi:hypothetical protein